MFDGSNKKPPQGADGDAAALSPPEGDWYRLDSDDPDRLIAEPYGHALRILQAAGPTLLLATADDGAVEPLLLQDNGTFRQAMTGKRGTTPSAQMLRVAEESNLAWCERVGAAFGAGNLVFDADARLNSKAFAAFLRQMKAGRTLAGISEAVAFLPGVVLGLREAGMHDYDVRECRLSDLNADTRYLAFADCVVDLDTGARLTGHDGAVALATVNIPDPYNPDADTNTASNLLAYLPESKRDYLLDSLAFALRGKPSRITMFLFGDANCGKSTIMEAFGHALGPYQGGLATGAIAPSRGGRNAAAASPDFESVVPPVRVSVYAESEDAVYSTARLKALSGGDSIDWRPLYGSPRSNVASATVWMVGNELPRKPIATDQGMRERIRVIDFPTLPAAAVDKKFGEAWQGGDVRSVRNRQATINLILPRAIAMTGPPIPPPDVQAEIAQVLASQRDPLEEWIKSAMVDSSASDVVTTAALWDAAKNYFEESSDSKTVQGKRQSELIATVKRLHKLGNAKQLRQDGVRGRGWRHVRLVDAEAF